MTSPEFSHLFVTKRRKDRPDKARDPQAGTPGPRKRTVGTLEAEGGGTRFAGRTVRPDHCADAVEGV
jgi:hypothetical protein